MDIALVFNPASLSFDYALSGGDLAIDNGLDTAVALSLFTDRLAAADDEIPDGSGDRRGWWGDLPPDGTTPEAQATDLIGSRFWLLSRAKRTQDTLNRAQGYGLEALQWLLDDGVAQTVIFAPQYQGDPSVGLMAVSGVIARLGANGGTIDHRFDLLWSSTLGS
jgi:phage gp46-like protein